MRFAITIELDNLLKIEFTFCQILQDFAILKHNTDKWVDGWIDQWTDRPTDRWTNGWKMFLSYTDAIVTSENDDLTTDFAIFSNASRTDGPTD